MTDPALYQRALFLASLELYVAEKHGGTVSPDFPTPTTDELPAIEKIRDRLLEDARRGVSPNGTP